jgi:hypothetical protein
MGTVTPMYRDPLAFVHAEADGRDLTACALVGIDSDGAYVLTSAGMSPEEMLMAAELLREKALDSAAE